MKPGPSKRRWQRRSAGAPSQMRGWLLHYALPGLQQPSWSSKCSGRGEARMFGSLRSKLRTRGQRGAPCSVIALDVRYNGPRFRAGSKSDSCRPMPESDKEAYKWIEAARFDFRIIKQGKL